MTVPANITALMMADGGVFPVEEGTRATFTGGGTTVVCTLPSGIVAGESLLVFVVHDAGTAVTFNNGFTKIGEKTVGASSGTAISVGHKVAVGSDTAPTASWSTISVAAGVSTRVSGAGTPEASAGASAEGTAHDPDSLTPAGGKKKYLWFAAAGVDVSTDYTSAPSGYGTLTTLNNSSVGVDCAIGIAARESEASSEDPGAFTGASGNWVALTVAVPPA